MIYTSTLWLAEKEDALCATIGNNKEGSTILRKVQLPPFLILLLVLFLLLLFRFNFGRIMRPFSALLFRLASCCVGLWCRWYGTGNKRSCIDMSSFLFFAGGRTVSGAGDASVTRWRQWRISVHGVRTSLGRVRTLVNRHDRLGLIAVQSSVLTGIDQGQQGPSSLHHPQLI